MMTGLAASSTLHLPLLGLARNTVHLWFACIDVSSAELEALSETLVEDEHERAGRFRFRRDRWRFIAARGILRYLLSRERGEILNLIDAPFASASVITSVTGAARGNHYHKTDYHYGWLKQGQMICLRPPAGATGPAQRWTIKGWADVLRYGHAMWFTKASVLLVFARNNREMANYEADTVRIPPLT